MMANGQNPENADRSKLSPTKVVRTSQYSLQKYAKAELIRIIDPAKAIGGTARTFLPPDTFGPDPPPYLPKCYKVQNSDQLSIPNPIGISAAVQASLGFSSTAIDFEWRPKTQQTGDYL
jgi:hypothetical protein